MYTLLHYVTVTGRDSFQEWLDDLMDRQAQARVLTRIGRFLAGNFGDAKSVGGGVMEARIHWGPGYRVYYAITTRRVILLLLGGDKHDQQADIQQAIEYWQDWKRRKH